MCPQEQSDKVVTTPSRKAGEHRAVPEADGNLPTCVGSALLQLLPPALCGLCPGCGVGERTGLWALPQAGLAPGTRWCFSWLLAEIAKFTLKQFVIAKKKFLQVATVADSELLRKRETLHSFLSWMGLGWSEDCYRWAPVEFAPRQPNITNCSLPRQKQTK